MNLAIGIGIFTILAAIALTRPRAGVVLVFAAIWLYPNTFLYGSLPLNVRFDNLLCLFVFFVCLFSPHSRRTTGPLVSLALFWTASILIGNITGLVLSGETGWQDIVKSAARSFYVPLTTYALYNLLSNAEQIERLIRAILLAAAAASVLAIAMVYFPSQLDVFLIPTYNVKVGMTALEMLEASTETIGRRAQGAVGVMSLAIIMQNMALLSLAMMISHIRHNSRAFYAATLAVSAAGLAYTATRGAIGGFLAAVLWALAFTTKRRALIAILILGALALALQGDIVQRVLLRLTEPTVGTQSQLERGLEVRLSIVRLFIENFSPVYFFFGMGMSTIEQTQAATAHNAYLGALVYSGLLGVIALALLVRQGWVLARQAISVPDNWFVNALGLYLGMLVVALIVHGFVLENFQHTYGMQLYFAAMVFVERALAATQHAPAIEPTPLMPSQPVIMAGPYVAR